MSAGTRSAEPARAIFQPAGASFEGNELRFVAVLVDVFDAQRGIQVPDMPRVGDGHAFDRGVRIPEIFREDEFGAFFDGLPLKFSGDPPPRALRGGPPCHALDSPR